MRDIADEIEKLRAENTVVKDRWENSLCKIDNLYFENMSLMHENAELKAANEWNFDMKSAPDDGTEIIGCGADWVGQMSYFCGGWEIHGKQQDGYIECDTAVGPICWRYLPKPPEEQT